MERPGIMWLAIMQCSAMLFTAQILHAKAPFDIQSVEFIANGPEIYLDREKIWKEGLSQVLCELTVRENVVEKLVVKAYVFDRQKKLMFTKTKASSYSEQDSTGARTTGTNNPPFLKEGYRYTLQFEAPELDSDPNWKYILVVVGIQDYMTADVQPNYSIKKLDFPEKEKLLTKDSTEWDEF